MQNENEDGGEEYSKHLSYHSKKKGTKDQLRTVLILNLHIFFFLFCGISLKILMNRILILFCEIGFCLQLDMDEGKTSYKG